MELINRYNEGVKAEQDKLNYLKIVFFKMFGEKDITLEFKDKVMIIVGENGSGKTTLLNALFYLINKNLDQLLELDFEGVQIQTFDSNIMIHKTDFEVYKLGYSNEYKKIMKRLNKHLIPDELKYLDLVLEGKEKINDFIINFRQNIESRSRFYNKIIFDIRKLNELAKESMEFNSDIEENIEAMYFILNSYFIGKKLHYPTYRRIEEELEKIGYRMKNQDLKLSRLNEENNELIKFGMSDVNQLFTKITSDIIKSTTEGLRTVTGEMLTQIVNKDSNDITNEIKKIMKRKDIINIVLERVKKDIPEDTSNKLRQILLDKNFGENTYNEFLLYFLHNFIKIYEKSANKEKAIRQFEKVCNKYLVDKEVRYDEGAVKIGIYRKANDSNIKLSELSSGEKQIVSVFAKLYLSGDDKYVIFFDEPELSLSIKWQQMFLEDILNSEKCTFLFSVTHSPFIYNNVLKKYAQPIELMFEEVDDNE